MTDLALDLVCLAALLLWAARTLRMRRAGMRERRGLLVPLGILLLWGGLTGEQPALAGLGIGLALVGEFWPDRVRLRAPTPPFPRWRDAQEPDRPDVELHLEHTGARLHNVGETALRVHGWSPAHTNGWLPLRADDSSGQPITVLGKGEWARLSPWPLPNTGVRVWYAREDEPEREWIFRADWTGLERRARELN